VDTSYGSVRAPAEMGLGTVKIILSFPEWKMPQVVPATYEIQAEVPKSTGK
jgi:hypothetical protein